jgi:flavin reductase (DIM6/NTAB) family NADH-FMN oxidoreductase RutF
MENIHLTNNDIANAAHAFRINLVNSVSGIKPGNLIGTIGENGRPNVAVFSSVIHLGSNPPLLGFILRPSTDVRRHTWENIQETGCFTINHIHSDIIKNAHYTSAKFDDSVSEFDACNLSEEFIKDFPAPFVAESKIKIGLKFRELIPIPLNNTALVIGEIEHIIVPKDAVAYNGRIDLSTTNSVGVSGLNRYYDVKQIQEFPYARANKLPSFS